MSFMKFALLVEIDIMKIGKHGLLAPCLVDQPDLDELAKAPEVRFQSIDAKLSNL